MLLISREKYYFAKCELKEKDCYKSFKNAFLTLFLVFYLEIKNSKDSFA